MKLRRKLAALLAAAMIASVMPMTAFAASRNRIDKVITVEKDAVIEEGYEPTISIRLDDTLTTKQSFYLELDGAEWLGFDDLVDRTGGTPSDRTNEFHYTVDNKTGIEIFEVHREGDSILAFRLLGVVDGDEDANTIKPDNNPNLNFEFQFPLATKVTGGEAKVSVVMYDTTITNTDHLFAVSEGTRAKVVVADAPAFYSSTEIAKITLEETFAKSLRGIKDQDERWFTLELRDPDFTFAISEDGAKLTGERAYRGLEDTLVEGTSYRLSKDRTRLGIKITDKFIDTALDERGKIALTGVEVIAARGARDGEVKATIESKKLFDKEVITIAKRGDYKTKLSVADDWEYEVVAGTDKEVTFKLSEELANSLIGTRPATFTFDQGVTIKGAGSSSDKWNDWEADGILWDEYKDNSKIREALEKIDKIEKSLDDNDGVYDYADLLDAKIRLYELLNLYSDDKYERPGKEAKTGEGYITVKGSDVNDKDEWSSALLARKVHVADNMKSFTVDSFDLIKDKAGSYTFTTTLKIPANVTGDIKVAVEGRGVTEEEIVILKAEAPVTVDATGVDVKVGLKEIETTGKIVIKETKEGRIRQGKDIVLRIDDIDSGLKIKSFDYEVVAGDLILDDAYGKWAAGDEAVGVKRSSTEASTIEITNIVMFTDRTVPEGKYDLLVGGNAISDHSKNVSVDKDAPIDEVATIENFVNITTKNTEDIADGYKAEVKFVVGASEYLVNGKEVAMDAPAYVRDGRTMVPVRYVAVALGVDADQVTWDQANQTATIIADKVVQVKLGSKSMIVNGVSIPMDVPAELTNDRTFVPVASIARALGVVVEWDQTNQTATFNPAK